MGGDALGIGTAVSGVAGGAAAAYGAKKQAETAAADREQAGRGMAYDPTNPLLKGLIGKQTDFLGGAYGGTNPYAQFTSPLQQQATNQMGQFLNQPAPESRVLDETGGAMGRLAQSGSNQFTNPLQTQRFGVQQSGFDPLQMQRTNLLANPAISNGAFNPGSVQAQNNSFGELHVGRANVGMNPFMQQMGNPFGQQGFENPGQNVLNAAQPLFEQNLRKAQGQLASSAPGRFSSAFVDQGQDLASQALQDFNLFSAQQMFQGEQLKAQQQAQAQQFMLGSRGLAQDAFGQQQGANLQQQELAQSGQLQARGLAQDASLQGGAQNLQAQMANQNAALQAAGMQTDAISQHNQAQIQAQQLFQSGQLDARGMEQSLFQSLQQLGLDANTAAAQAQLQAQQIASGALTNQQQNQIGAAGQYGQLAQMAGQNQWQRLLQGGQFGLDASNAMINPLMQLQLAGLQYGAPSDMNVVMGANSISGLGLGGKGTPGGGGGGGGDDWWTNKGPIGRQGGGRALPPGGGFGIGGGGGPPGYPGQPVNPLFQMQGYNPYMGIY